MRRFLATLCVGLLAVVAIGCTPDETNAALMVQSFRTSNGVAALNWDDPLYAKAQAWSQRMADEGRLYHSNLADGAPAGWRILGENVAWNTNLEAAIHALEASPAHRANLLNPRFTRGAIGIVYQGGRYWVTQEFVG